MKISFLINGNDNNNYYFYYFESLFFFASYTSSSISWYLVEERALTARLDRYPRGRRRRTVREDQLLSLFMHVQFSIFARLPASPPPFYTYRSGFREYITTSRYAATAGPESIRYYRRGEGLWRFTPRGLGCVRCSRAKIEAAAEGFALRFKTVFFINTELFYPKQFGVYCFLIDGLDCKRGSVKIQIVLFWRFFFLQFRSHTSFSTQVFFYAHYFLVFSATV